MSTSIVLKQLSLAEMKPCPIMNLWALSELNGLKFWPGNSISECWIEQKLAGFLMGKQTLKTARNGVLRGVKRHPQDSDMILYGDLHRESVTIDEATETTS